MPNATSSLSNLQANLTKYFSPDELELLCFNAGIDKDNIPGKDKGKDYFVAALLTYIQRRGRILPLLVQCYLERLECPYIR